MFRKSFFVLTPIFLVVFLFYFPVLGTYFTGDDFFHFRVSQTAGARGLLYLFGFHPFSERGIAFYRPIFRELLYLNFYNLFGLNQLPFRIFQFLILFINIGLSYLLMNRLFKKRIISFLTAFFVGISAANVGILYYLAGGIQTLGASMFVLLTIIFFLDYLEKEILKYKVFAFITFFLALASHETSIALIPILFFLNFVSQRKLNRQAFFNSIKELWLPIVVSFIYLFLEARVIGFSEGEVQYHPVFNLKSIANTYSWYGVWAFGLPESLVDFVGSGLKLNPNLLKYWGNYYRIIFPTFFFSILVFIFSFGYLLIKKSKILLNKFFLLLVIWFICGILPLAILPLHKSVYYLSVPLAAFWGIVFYTVFNAYELIRKKLKISLVVFIIFVLSLFVLSFTTTQLAKTTYWAKTRGDYALEIINQIKTKYPDLPNNSILYLKNDPNYPFIAADWGSSSKQAFFILNGSDAINLLYKGKSISVYYEDMGGLPKNVDSKQVFQLTVKIF